MFDRGDKMTAFRGFVIWLLLASPVWAEAHEPVIGAKRKFHDAAPLPVDGEGDYGFSGTAVSRSAQEPAGAKSAPKLVPPDAALLAYEKEEALMEAEAAVAADDTGRSPVTIID